MTDAREANSGPGRAAGWGRSWRRASVILSVMVLIVLAGTACSLDGLLNSDELPPNVSDPKITQTADGARAAYYGTLARFREAFGGTQSVGGAQSASLNSIVATAGLLSDELSSGLSLDVDLDARKLLESSRVDGTSYSGLQKARNQAGQAIGLLTRYLPDEPALAAHLYAIQGYAEVFLAEVFCSGVPLSTLDYAGDFTYQPGSTTNSVFAHAVALFDTALALAGDSVRVVDLARVGQARALLGVGAYAGAAAAVGAVSTDYHYDVAFNNLTSGTGQAQNFAAHPPPPTRWHLSVQDREGINGLDWHTSGDPRTQVTSQGKGGTSGGIIIYHPDKYAIDGSSPIVLASGVEARLIEAEAALQTSRGEWLTKLNDLRQSPAVCGTIVPATTCPLSTLEDPGASLSDPADAQHAREDLLFRERAFWLFLTGHRQGDLRRLIRQYGRLQSAIYPVGIYPGSLFPYGSAVSVPIPEEEAANPLYTGCAPGAA